MTYIRQFCGAEFYYRVVSHLFGGFPAVISMASGLLLFNGDYVVK